jgi:CHAD domain-containing protein
MGKEREPDPNAEYAAAMRDLIAVRWAAVWKAIPIAIAGEDIEGVHDVRVASRRLRAAMDVAVGCFADSWYGPLHRVAKEITAELGEVRDRDVMIEFLQKDLEGAPPGEHPGIQRLIDRVDRERDEARAEMLEFLADLADRGTAGETVRRFGPLADPNRESREGSAA